MAPSSRALALARLHQAFSQLDMSIDLCLGHDLKTPALMLLFSGMDIAGWIATDNLKGKAQSNFLAWAEWYIRPAKALGCSALDLYGARCGVVHTFTPESGLHKKGTARKVIYAWSPSRVETLRGLITRRGLHQYVAIQGDNLVRAYRSGIRAFLKDLYRLPAEQLQAKAEKLFTVLPSRTGEVLLAMGEESSEG